MQGLRAGNISQYSRANSAAAHMLTTDGSPAGKFCQLLQLAGHFRPVVLLIILNFVVEVHPVADKGALVIHNS